MKTRIFTRDELDAIGVPYECGVFEGSAEELHEELWDTTRWSHVYEFVFRAPDDDKTYQVYYWSGATEMQGQDVWDWANEIQAVEVEQVQVTKTEWKPVKSDG